MRKENQACLQPVVSSGAKLLNVPSLLVFLCHACETQTYIMHQLGSFFLKKELCPGKLENMYVYVWEGRFSKPHKSDFCSYLLRAESTGRVVLILHCGSECGSGSVLCLDCRCKVQIYSD